MSLWLSAITLIVPGCLSFTLEEPSPLTPEPAARARPSDWGYSNALSTCTSSASDDVCERCEKTACCSEIEACDGDCLSRYQEYQRCLYPLPGSPWSGLGSKACVMRLPASPSTLQAVALINCAASKCSTQETCGIEPRATFSLPPATPPAAPPASDFSAAQFLEDYCVGCHFDGFLGPTGKQTSAFSHDKHWWTPRWNASWLAAMDYELAVEKGPAIACGVSKDHFSQDCLTLPSVDPGFFTGPGKFPPSGHGMYSGLPNPCRFAADGATCPQPTDFERARLLSWLADGAPR